MPEPGGIASLRACWARTSSPSGIDDYGLLGLVDGAFAARTQRGVAALVVPIAAPATTTVGRRASGFELVGHPSIRFAYEGRTWNGPAAALICTDDALGDAFAVLSADIALRTNGIGTWEAVLSIVSEWQTLLAPVGKPSVELEMGLWGELWFLARSVDIDRALASWRGPEGDSTDFFVGGKAAEVKTSRHRRVHYVSQSQVDEPVGAHEAWLLSITVKPDPAASLTVPVLSERILSGASDKHDAIARLKRAGYSIGDRTHYATGYVVLEEPEWYAAADVPRVRSADAGVSQLRYRTTLDEARRAGAARAARLWDHFNGREYGD